MTKHGMKHYVHAHGDPTFDAVRWKWRKEARRAAEHIRSMVAFRVLATVRKIISMSGYRLASELIIIDRKTGNRYGRMR